MVLAWAVVSAGPPADAWTQALRARARLDFVTARRFLEAVVAAPEDSIPRSRRAAGQLALGETCVQLGDLSCARAAFAAALELDESLTLPVTTPPQAQQLLAEARSSRPRPPAPPPKPVTTALEPTPMLQPATALQPVTALQPAVEAQPTRSWIPVVISGAAAGAFLAVGIAGAFASQAERSKLSAGPLFLDDARAIDRSRLIWAGTSVGAYVGAGICAVVSLVLLLSR
jgi:hypothetical protein